MSLFWDSTLQILVTDERLSQGGSVRCSGNQVVSYVYNSSCEFFKLHDRVIVKYTPHFASLKFISERCVYLVLDSVQLEIARCRVVVDLQDRLVTMCCPDLRSDP